MHGFETGGLLFDVHTEVEASPLAPEPEPRRSQPSGVIFAGPEDERPSATGGRGGLVLLAVVVIVVLAVASGTQT